MINQERFPPDGGAAFPFTFEYESERHIQTGMTLRDYFAGQALVGCFNFWVQVHAHGASIGDPDQMAITQLAYEYADAMLKARKS